MSMVIIGHFGDESLQSVNCIGTEKPEQAIEHVQNTSQCNQQNGPNKQQYKTHTQNLG